MNTDYMTYSLNPILQHCKYKVYKLWIVMKSVSSESNILIQVSKLFVLGESGGDEEMDK